MAFAEPYRRQVALLLRTIPFIATEKCFALKGGTAINLFVRDLPRLSVDIDLTYLPVYGRAKSLGAIDKAMKRIAARAQKGLPHAHITHGVIEGAVTKLIVREAGVQIIVEVTPVMRGCAYECAVRAVSPPVEKMFGFAEMQVVSFADLYAGKIVAALDRQHPRDLFDIKHLLANEGIDDALRAAFVVYLLSHNRPMFEVLGGRPKDISAEFLHNFEGMTAEPVKLEAAGGASGDDRSHRRQDAWRSSQVSRLVRIRRTRLGAPGRPQGRQAACHQMAATEPGQAHAEQEIRARCGP
jgi:predicted nucleotidyltransferase component of viral defense system